MGNPFAPTKEKDGTYSPSWLARSLFAPMFGAKTVPLTEAYEAKCEGKILVVGSSKRNLVMTNGKTFSTGHNVSETLLPMHHLSHAGYTFDIATGDGETFAFEEWSWVGPKANKNEAEARKVLADNKAAFDSPITTTDALEKLMSGEYVAAFFPGGHGTMIEMHDPARDDGATANILAHLHEKQIPTITLCHGPNVLRAAPKGTYDGYQIFGYPDAVDKGNAGAGYTPGPQKEWMEEELAKVGVTLVNKAVDDLVCTCKEVISASGPQGAMALGAVAVKMLVRRRDQMSAGESEQTAPVASGEEAEAGSKPASLGVMAKKGGAFGTAWQPRYFTFDEASGTLAYYKSQAAAQSQTNARGSLQLKAVKAADAPTLGELGVVFEGESKQVVAKAPSVVERARLLQLLEGRAAAQAA